MSALRYSRRATVRDIVLAVIAVVLIVVAVTLFMYLRKPHDAPTDQFVKFHCPKCPHDFQLSYADFDRVWERNEYRILGQRRIIFKCPKCGQMTAERVEKPDASPSAAPPLPAGPEDRRPN